MSEQPQKRRNVFDAMWPWPGVALLALLAAWFVYMGMMAQVKDVSTAFLGLGGVAAFLALLGLRTVNRGGPRTGRQQADASQAVEGRKRSSIPDEMDEPAAVGTGEFYTAEETHSETPLDEERERQELEEVEAMEEEERPRRARRRAEIAQLANAPVPQDARSRFSDLGEVGEAIQQLEVLINREKAERGAALARLAGRGEDDEGAPAYEGGRDLNVALEERLNNYLTIPAFNNAMNQRVFPQVNQMIKKALNEKIGPEALMEQVGQAAASSSEDEKSSVTFALQLAEARQALEAHIEEVQKDRKAMREEIRGARKVAERAAKVIDTKIDEGTDDERHLVAVVKELRAARRADRERLKTIEAALKAGNLPSPPEGGDGAPLGIAIPDLETRFEALAAETRRQIDEALGALEGAGDSATAPGEAANSDQPTPATRRQVHALRREITEVREQAEQQLAELGAAVNEIRMAAQRMAADIEAAQKAQVSLAARLDALGEAAGEDGSGEPAGGDVDALRDALTTIIEQNRAIRAQQDMLTARFDTPAKGGSEQDR